MINGSVFAVAVALNLTNLASSGPLPTDHIDKQCVRQSIPFFLLLAQIYHVHQIEMGCQSYRALRHKPRRTGADLPQYALLFKLLVSNAHPMDPQ
jgi:hypothetical protein